MRSEFDALSVLPRSLTAELTKRAGGFAIPIRCAITVDRAIRP